MIFVVQEHFASHRHFDFRIEMDGVLKSWAIPREIPEQPNRKVLAVEVEDHPLSYAHFEGEIPEGMYGAGKVTIWDEGRYTLREKSRRKVVLKLHGKKLKGEYVLILFKNERGKNYWLFFKKKNNENDGRKN